jgi:glutathione S-transferase
MITLYTFGAYWGLPDPSPFVMKADMLLKLSRLPYEANTRGFPKAPKGKLPYLRDGDTVVADSTFIRLYLEKQYAIDFDKHLSAHDRGVAWAAEKMLEDHLYWVIVYWRWLNDANFERGPKAFFDRAPALIRPMVIPMVRKRVRATLHAHGIGRHSEAETTALAARGIESLAQMLGDQPYFMGSTPCGADATVFAFVASILVRQFESPIRDQAARMSNLVAYHDRMMREFYPEFVK